VQVRAQREKVMVAKSHVAGMGHKASAMKTQVAMAESMKQVGGAMAAANKAVDIKGMSKTMLEFQRANEVMGVQEEMMDDALCDAFDGDGVEEEADELTAGVLAELGLQLDGQMADAPTAAMPARAVEEKEEDLELPDLKERLRAL
jgi:division protein CdvB (Snf7/Vps24/ESCRT-III family)